MFGKLKDAFTGNDNTTEFIFLGAGVALVVGLFLVSYDTIKLQHPFDWEKFGSGLGWLFGGAGLGYGGKKFGDRQPNAPDTVDNAITQTSTMSTTSTSVTPLATATPSSTEPQA